MNRRFYLTILILTLFLLTLASMLRIASASPDDFELIYARWGDAENEEIAVPGGQTSLTVFIKFKPPGKDDRALDVLASLDLPSPFRTATGVSKCYYWVDSMSLGDIEPFTFSFNIPPDAEPGEYTFTLHLNYRYVVTEGTIGENKEQSFTFQLPLYQRTELLVEPETSFLVKGATQSLELRFTCEGESDLLVTSLTVTSASSSVIGHEAVLPIHLLAGTSTSVDVKVYVPEQASSVGFSVEVHYLLHGLEHTLTRVFSLPTIEALKPLSIEADSYELSPDALNSIKLTLTNTATQPITNLTLSLSGQALSLIGSNEVWVEEVEAGGIEEVEVVVRPSSQADSYLLTVQVNYAVGDMAYSDTFNLFFTKSTRPRLSFSSIEVSRTGEYVYVRGQVINVGRSAANYVNVTASSEQLSFEKGSTYIGTLEPGEAASFLLTSPIEEPGIYYVTLSGFYADEAGSWFVEVREVQITVEEVPGVEGARAVSIHELLLPVAGLGIGLFIAGLVIGRYVGGRREA